MERRGAPEVRRPALVVTVLGAAIVCAAMWQGFARSKINTIQQLSSLPAGASVRLAGVVVFADDAHTHFRIRDATGNVALTVEQPQPGIAVGEAVAVEATKPVGAAPAPPPAPARKNGQPVKGRATAPKPPPAAAGKNSSAAQSNGPSSSARSVASDNAVPPAPGGNAAEIPLDVTKIHRDLYLWIEISLGVAFLLVGLVFLAIYSALQRAALQKATETTHALRLLSAAVQRLTREGKFDIEVPIHGDADVAPLAIGVNAMLAELSQRDKARRDAESRLEHWALVDDLTGLPNRRLLSDRLSQSLTKAERDRTTLALVSMDLDDFKLVNDSLGHAAGDMLLSAIAQRLKDCFRKSDTLARIGGDEFALILDKIHSVADAQTAAENLLELLRPPFDIQGHSVQVTASVGISIFPDKNQRGQLLQQADCAMFAAKRNGKARIVQFSDDLGSAARERLTLEGELQHAIARGEISVVYQPEFDLSTNAIVRFEALARWTHPQIGLIMPMSFIPVAEEKGLIIPLGAYVMERACMEAVTWQKAGERPVQVAVNVSTVQFGRDSFFEEVADILHRTGLHPSLLQIELTESATVAGVERAAEMMRRLKRMGVSVAVDDFGTGYSCLSYLPKLSFDAVKLDRSFVHELMTRRETKSFVKSILELAHNLHMKVIAEGIENRQQLSLIKSLGTDEAQGFLLGKPVHDPLELLLLERSSEAALAQQILRESSQAFVS
jgi:diguanylate cyclase (GGDEF)-like protein